MISLSHYLILGALLFAISVVGIFLNRKNVIILLMAIELMLLAVNLNFIAFSHYLNDISGQVFVFFILTVAAAESAIGLAILLIEISVFLLIRWRVLKPLLASTGSVSAIAQGKLDMPWTQSRRSDEIGDMQRAIIALRQTSADKQALEIEHDRLIAELKHHSSVDFLTKLLNRRAFSERVAQQLAIARSRVDVPLVEILRERG